MGKGRISESQTLSPEVALKILTPAIWEGDQKEQREIAGTLPASTSPAGSRRYQPQELQQESSRVHQYVYRPKMDSQ